jgi:hypothetical protein
LFDHIDYGMMGLKVYDARTSQDGSISDGGRGGSSPADGRPARLADKGKVLADSSPILNR